MSVEHMASVFAAQGLTGPEKLHLLALANYTDAQGYCWPSVERLAADTGTSPATVKRITRILVDHNLLRKIRRTDKQGNKLTNLYRVNLPKLSSMRRPDRSYDDNIFEHLTFADETPSDQPRAQSEPPLTSLGLNLSPTRAQSEPHLGLNLSPYPSVEPLTSSLLPPSPTEGAEELEEEEGMPPAQEPKNPTPTGGQHRKTAVAIVDDLPAIHGHRVGPTQRLQLIDAVEARLAQGWKPADLSAELRRDLATARSTGVFYSRLAGLSDIPPDPAPVSTPAPARAEPHAWIDGGPNGACMECGSPLTAVHHIRAISATTATDAPQCEHGRPARRCVECQAALAHAEGRAGNAPESPVGTTGSSPELPNRGHDSRPLSGDLTETDDMDPRLVAVLDAMTADSARR